MCGQHETTPLSIPKHVLPGLALAEKQADRFNQLINDLLDMSKIRAGKLEYHFKRVSLSSIVHTVTERLTKVLEAEGCPLEIDLDPKIVGYWDQSRIQDVLVNLLMNARKYARGSRVQVTTRFKENRAILTVRDFGPGIPKEMQSRIFERFERATATTDSTRGLGLGLYIAKTVAERHQGTIEVESEVGVGTTFIVKLPLIVRGEPIHWQTEGSLLRSKRRRNAAAKEHRTPSESDAPLAQNSAASAQDSVPPLQDSVNSAQNSVTSTQDLAPPPAL